MSEIIDSLKQVGTSPVERWYVAGLNTAAALTTGAPTVGQLYAVPFVSRRRGIIDQVAFNVTTLISLGVARVGIYDNLSNINIYPNNLILDCGEFSTATTGMKTATVSQQLNENSLYWFVFLAGTAAATIRCLTLANMAPLLGASNVLATALGVGWKVAQAYGALPVSFPAGAAVLAAVPIPAIGVRYSV